ncbi:hypothetical protein PP175_05705 [Aneurinibacillus sp. Ricciae_BoGa-3]|uniref:hypothetical protein n=1 Tax=Aneurinibacillus sp. Ricciae_BoGa-3 TaxID=3022697 RepID=UPI002340B566|nr:hypothetical protein [Aneurinibacillus sp. Ricciae_BoGa-3]WCK55446.1 hypothetical protein PP175_05705 [Aneurinibacillus sp. Ricciae_BoGa-3]
MQTVFLGYAQTIITAVLVGMVGILIRSLFNKVESIVAAHTTPDVATKVNGMLDTVERLTEAVVQDLNSRIVIGLKQSSLFTKETADSIKEAAVKSVVENLGPLKDEAISLLGPIEDIVGQMVEKYVMKGKDQVNQIVGTAPVQPEKPAIVFDLDHNRQIYASEPTQTVQQPIQPTTQPI